MNAAMDPSFRYYDCSEIVDSKTGKEQDNLTIMVAVPRIDLSTPENRQENLVSISKIVEEQIVRNCQIAVGKSMPQRSTTKPH